MEDTYQYIGGERRGYFAYVDTDTHHMLIADPGGTYRMRPVDPSDAMPPPDGRWLAEPLGQPESVDVPSVEAMPPPSVDAAHGAPAGTVETGDEQ